MAILLSLYISSGTLLVILSIPLLFENIPPNPIYGFRVSATLEDRQLWYAANTYASKCLMGAGLTTILGAIALYLIPGISLDVYALGCLAVVSVALGIGLYQSLMYIKVFSKKPASLDKANR